MRFGHRAWRGLTCGAGEGQVTFARRAALSFRVTTVVTGAAALTLLGSQLAAVAGTSPSGTLPPRLIAQRAGQTSTNSSGSSGPAASSTKRSHGIDAALAGVHGPVAVMLELKQQPAAAAYAATARTSGKRAGDSAFKSQTGRVKGVQRTIERALRHRATKSTVLFGTHALYSGVAVTTDASRLPALAALPGVQAIHPLTPKHMSSSVDGVTIVGAPPIWQARSNIGTGVTIGVIDTGIDYTHADFGGPGTQAAYDDALDHDTDAPDYPAGGKVAGGYDLAGDAYDATPGSGDQTPVPDPNPLDCNGHGSHVAGTAAGDGVDNSGDTYAGPYDTTVSGSGFRIEPGVAPGATIVPLKIFGCDADATTDLVSEALDRAADPNGDGNPSDHLDVVNLSLGSGYTSPQDPDAVAAGNAADLGIVVVAAAGNDGDAYDAGGAPGNAPQAIAVAASDSSDRIADFSSRGVRGAGNTKPDITAPGVAINSVAFGTGSFGEAEVGTSMATPHVSGSAALILEQNPTWTSAQVKAALLDTASGAVTMASGAVAPPMRAGSGLVQVNQALSTSALAYSASEPSAVSLSFGTVTATSSIVSVTKSIRLASLRNTVTSYTAAFHSASMPAGVSVTLGHSAFVLPANGAVDIPVTLTVDPTKLKLTADPAKTKVDADLDQWIAEASGWVVLSPADRGPDLRVSVYAAPRRASTMAAASSGKVSTASFGTGTLALSGTGFGSGANSASGTYASLLTATQLQATSAQLPSCASVSGADPAVPCIPFTDEKAADIRYVGTSSDVHYCTHDASSGIAECVGKDAKGHRTTFDALVNVAVTTWGTWRTPATFAQFNVWWDTNGDGVPDAVTLNTRLSNPCTGDSLDTCGTDQLVAQTYLPCPSSDAHPDEDCLYLGGRYWQGLAANRVALNTIGGMLDTSPYDSNALVLPVAVGTLEDAGWNPTSQPHLRYWLTTSSVESPGATVDSVASSVAPLKVTVSDPALSAVGDLGLPELNSDKAGSAYTLKVRQDVAALMYDLPASGTPSLLLIHHDNGTSTKAQVVPIKRSATVSVAPASKAIKTTTKDKVTVTVSPSSATGSVSCRDGTKVVATASLSGGRATCTLPVLKKGSHSINAVYAGSTLYAPATSASVTVKVS
jgi:subtilisin family serine protease